MARKKTQKAKPKAVTSGKKPATRTRRSGASSTSTVHDASSAPTTTATENKKPTAMTGGISKKTTRRMPARMGRKDPWSEEQLTTSSKSRLVNVDLVKLFANPNSWTCLEEDEKRELLSLLPAHIHPNPGPDPDDPDHKIEPLPQSFLRYSNNWRDAVRGFQFDLESGRYDPEWQSQAAQAMEERVSGKFDQIKEDQFEEFWGQKQKLSYDVETGDSNQVKLKTLVENGVVRPGDIWKYSRIYVKDGVRILLEKEIKVLSVDENNGLTFAIPGGHRVFLSQEYSKTESPAAQAVPDNSNPGSQPRTKMNSEAEIKLEQTRVGPKPEAESVTDFENGTATILEAEAEASIKIKPDTVQPSSNPTDQSNVHVVDTDSVSKEDTPMPIAPPPEDTNPTDPSNVPVVDGDPPSKGDTPMPAAPAAAEDTNPTDSTNIPVVDGDSTSKGDILMPSAPPAAEDTNNPTLESSMSIVDADPVSKEDTPMPTAPPATGDPSRTDTSNIPVVDGGPHSKEDTSMPSASTEESINLTGPSSLPLVDGEPASKEDTPMLRTPPTAEDITPQDTTSENIVSQNATPNEVTAENNTAEPTGSDVAISKTNTLEESTNYNPNTNDTTNPDADVILPGVYQPNNLGVKILEIDGRITKPSHGNAWKDFRCIRNNQDMGSLWEVRQAWSVRGK